MTDDADRGDPPEDERYRIDEQHPSVSIVEAVADARDEGATELDPLARSVDPDALDALYGSIGDATGTASITFGYGGRRVRVSNDQEVTVSTKPIGGIDGGDDSGVPVDASRESVSLAVVRVISDRTGRDTIEIGPPLAGVVDPQALDRLLQHETFRGAVRFEYAGYGVAIVADDRVAIEVTD